MNIKIYNEWLEKLKSNPIFTTIDDVPEEYRTEEMCITAVQCNYENLQKIPRKYITYELCFETVQYHGCAIEFVPSELLTNEICIKAT